MSKIIALIPARGGSKGIKGKNLRMVGAFTLVDLAIMSCIDNRLIHQVYVSSDDQAILDSCNAKVRKIKRSSLASSDEASANDVILDALQNKEFDSDSIIIYLQPTSPLRTAHDVNEALNLYLSNPNCVSVISVVEVEKSPFKSFVLNDAGFLQSLFDEKLSNYRRQDLTKTYTPNGAIYIFSLKKFKENGGIPSNGGKPYVMPKDRSIDIDDELDLKLANFFLTKG